MADAVKVLADISTIIKSIEVYGTLAGEVVKIVSSCIENNKTPTLEDVLALPDLPDEDLIK